METGCKASRQDGKRCGGKALASGFCFAHDPELQDARRRGRTRGGQNKANVTRAIKAAPPPIAGVLGSLMNALQETHDGTLEPRQAQAMASLASSIGQLIRVHELERRIEAMELDRETGS